MSQDGKAHTITCRGCGQVGLLTNGPINELTGSRRRLGFYVHGKQDDMQVVACCKCQQIQPFETSLP